MAEGFITRRGGVGEPPEPTPTTFISATGGTTTTYQENDKFYRSHTFTSSGNFVVSSLSDVESANNVDYLIIGGGGAGGHSVGGGGGAGGYRATLGTSGGNSLPEEKVLVSTQTYPVIIGAGGSASSDTNDFTVNELHNGNITSALGIVSIYGGGAGWSGTKKSFIGGSGGGGGGVNSTPSLGLGIQRQGFNGGNGGGTSNNGGGGGGGGAGQIGANGVNGAGGNGGNGLANTLRNGTSETRAGGGGGASGSAGGPSRGLGGSGGGGQGGPSAIAGAVNTGSGGGGGSNDAGGGRNGGSGIVIIRYEVGAL